MEVKTMREQLLASAKDWDTWLIILNAPDYMYKKVSEYADTRIERVLSLAYVHAYHYAMSLDHAYKSILWTIRHARALHARSWDDALQWIEKQEDARYSANNLDKLIHALNDDIEDARHGSPFMIGLYNRREDVFYTMKKQAAALDHVREFEARENAREFVAAFISALRIDARERVHAIARIMRRADAEHGAHYIARQDVNKFLNRLYNFAAVNNTIDKAQLKQADFVYLLITYA